MNVTRITDNLIGREISCFINNVQIRSARIQKIGSDYYICQDLKDDEYCWNTLGYSYSWIVYTGSERDLIMHDVTQIVLLHSSPVEPEYDLF